MRFRDVEGRRAFFAQLLTAGGVSLAGCSRCARPASAPLEHAASGGYGVEILEEPIVLGSGDRLTDRSFALSDDFRASAVIVVAGNGVEVRDVRIIGSARWVAGATVGLRVEAVRDIAVERVSIEGLPSAGIAGHGIEGGLFRDVSIRHCDGGVDLRRDAESRALRLERVHADDLWGPASAADPPAGAGLERPEGRIGGEALALDSLRDSIVVDCTAAGEMRSSFALTNPRGVRIQGARGANLVIRGARAREPRLAGEAARHVVVEDCFLDKGLGRGAALFDASCVSLLDDVENVEIRDCVLNAAGQNGHAIELGPGVRARVAGCLIRGFNGVRGAEPAHALALGGGEVNEDFERVNRFVDQARIRLDSAPAPR